MEDTNKFPMAEWRRRSAQWRRQSSGVEVDHEPWCHFSLSHSGSKAHQLHQLGLI